MSNPRVQIIDWPLREFPNRERHISDEDVGEESVEQIGLKSVADSLVILQSLRQSRDRWLHSTFPKFSSRSRGNKPAEVVPPPHTIHNRGRCDIEIGPHIFPSTVVFEVHYQYIPPTVNASPYVYQPPIPHHTAPWQATTVHSTNTHAPHVNRPGAEQAAQHPNPIAASVEAVVSQQTSSPLSSLGAEVTITPGLITQVNMAAASNPTLANLLQMAASGQATADQLKTLSLLIQSLACISSNDASPAPSGATSGFGFETPQPDDAYKSSMPAPAYNAPRISSNYPAYRSFKEFDIVLEFSENPSDRWILPRSPAIIDHDHGAKTDALLLTVGVPFDKSPSQGGHTSSGADITQHLVTFRFSRASEDIKVCLSRWNGGQQSTEIALKTLNATLSQTPTKVYLAHQLQAGPQLTQLENSALPPYILKSIRPTQGDPIKPKRMRKPVVRKAAVVSADVPVVSLQTQSAPPAPSENTVLAQPLEQSLPVAGPSSQAPLPQAPAPKQRKQSKSQSTLPKMACGSCGQTDVPLVRGGSECFPIGNALVADPSKGFCRPCAGAEQVIPGVPANSGTFLHKFWTVSTPEQMQAQSVSAAQSRQQTPAISKRKAAVSRNQAAADVSNEPASASAVTKKKKAK